MFGLVVAGLLFFPASALPYTKYFHRDLRALQRSSRANPIDYLEVFIADGSVPFLSTWAPCSYPPLFPPQPLEVVPPCFYKDSMVNTVNKFV